MNRDAMSYAEREYLETRMGHKWQPCGKQSRKCATCGRRKSTKPSIGWKRRSYRYDPNEVICAKAHKPNRWRLHYRRFLDAQARKQQTRPVLAVRLMEDLRALEKQAARLPQDGRTWAFHPVPRRHRRIMRRLWTMPIPTEAAKLSPTANRLLTGRSFPGVKDHLPASTRAINAVRRIDNALFDLQPRWARQNGVYSNTQWDALPDLVRKAATAVRAIRPDLFAERVA